MSRLGAKFTALVTATIAVIATTIVIAPTPAAAQTGGGCGEGSDAFCGGFNRPGGPGGSGNNGGGNSNGGGPQTPPTGKYWWYVQPSYGPCGNGGELYAAYSTWLPSPSAPIVDPAGPNTIQCVGPTEGFGPAPGPTLPPIEDLRAQAKLLLEPATITSDFQSCFITQSDILFEADAPDTLTKDLDVPGFHVWLEAHPVGFDWTFDERAEHRTASSKQVTNRYLSKSLDGSHVANVQVTTVWEGELHINQLVGGSEQELQVDQLGTVSVESNMERAVVEVWSAQTRPNPGGSEGRTVECPES